MTAPITAHDFISTALAPRMRFIRRFILLCSIFALIGLSIIFARYEYPTHGWKSITIIPGIALYLAPAFAILCIPARTSRGSFLQLLGLPVPLLIAGLLCGGCWNSRPTPYEATGLCLLAIYACYAAMIFLYLPGWLLHQLLTFIENRRLQKPSFSEITHNQADRGGVSGKTLERKAKDACQETFEVLK